MQETRRTTESGAMLWTGRTMCLLVVLFMLFDSGIKLVPLDIVTETSRQLGLPTSAAFARGLGLTGLACTVLYAIPRTSILGAILLTAYMGGTVLTHLLAGSPIFTHMLFGVYLALLAWGGLYLRDDQVRRMIPLRRM